MATLTTRATTAATDGAGGTRAWGTPSGALAAGGSAARVADGGPVAAYTTAGLQLTNLASKPPSIATTITELKLRLYRHQDRLSAGPYVDDIADSVVKLMVGGVLIGGNKASGANWDTSLTWVEYTWTEAQLAAANVPLSLLSHPTFGFSISAVKSGGTDTIDAVIDDHEIVVTYTGTRKLEKDMDHTRLHGRGGMKTLLQEAIPAVSSSATIFANAPAGTRFVVISVVGQDIYLSMNGTPATATNGLAIPAGTGPHYFAMSQAAALACRAIQAGATATGTIVYLG